MLRPLLAAALAALAAPAAAQTCTTSWASPTTGLWEIAASWDNGVPEPDDVACITLDGTYTVTQSRDDRQVRGLVVGGASGTVTLRTTSVFTVTDGGVIRPTGVVEVLNRVPGGGDGLYTAGTLTVEGLLDYRGSDLLSTGGLLDVAPGGTLRIADNANAGAPAATFRIRGRLETVGTSTSQVNATLDVQGGTLRAASGRLDLLGGGTLADATLDVAEGAGLWLRAPFVASGTLGGAPAGTLFLTGTTLAAGPGGATLAVGETGLQLSGSARLTSGGGAFTNTGLLVHAATVSNFAALDGATLRNEGRFVMPGTGFGFRNGGVLRNEASGVVELVNGGSLAGVGGSDGRVENAGRIVHTPTASGAGGATGQIGVPYDGLPGSILRSETGRLDVRAGGTLRDAAFEVAEGAGVWLVGSASVGYTVTGTLAGAPAGTLFATGGTLAAGPGGATLAVGGTGLQLSGSAFLTSGGGGFTNTGLLRRATTGSNFAGVRAVTVRNLGTVDLTTSFRLEDGAVLRNEPGATVLLSAGGSLSGTGRLENAGLVLREGNRPGIGGTFGFNGQLVSLPGSELRTNEDRVDLDPPASQSFPEGALLTGTGAVRFGTGLEPAGTVSPGTAEQPVAELALVTSYRPAPTGRLVIDVGPDGQSDRLVSLTTGSPSVQLGGTLVLRLRPGYVPAVGDRFILFQRLVNPFNVPGDFAAVEVEGAMPPGLRFVVEKPGPGAVHVRVAAGVTVEALAAGTSEDGAPVTFVVRAAAPAPAGQALAVPLAFEGTARRFDDVVTDLPGSVLRIPPGESEASVTVFPLRDALAEGTETLTLRVLPGGDAEPGAPDRATITLADGPPSDALAVAGIAPSRGGAGGRVTASVFGQALGAGAAVRLVRGGTAIDGALVTPGASGAGLSARFDLAGAPAGVYDVVVERAGQAATLAGAFTVEPRRGVEVWADVVGSPNPRIGRWTTYTVHVGNSGNADVHDVALVLRLTAGLEFEVMEGIRDLPDAPAAAQLIELEAVTQAQVVPLWFRTLPAGYTGTFRVRVRPPADLFGIGDGVAVSYELYPPDPDVPFTWSGDFDDGPGVNYALMWGAFGAYVDAYPPENPPPPFVPAGVSAAREDDDSNDWSPRDQPPLIQNESVDDLIAQYSQGHRFNSYYGSSVQPSTATTVQEYAGFSSGQLLSNASRSAGYAASANAVGGVAAALTIRQYGLKAQGILADRCMEPPCGSSGGPGSPGGGPSGGAGPGGGPGGGGPGGVGGNGPNGGPGTGGAGGKAGGSRDPNDKLGPAGVAAGEQRFLTLADPARYTIRFENLETVTFPAQEVIIADTLDLDVFDPATFSLGPIAFGDRVLLPPPGLQTFTAEVDLAPALPASVLVHARFEPATGRATWTFTTLDPATRDLPEDGLVGFLPPNRTSPEGEGSVGFTVRLRPGLPTGTRLANRAEIVFDINAPIVTPVWTNTVDVTPPVTAVEPLPTSSASPFTVAVGAADAGVGVQAVALYVSVDGGPFRYFGATTDRTFEVEGELGRTYAFYSIGADFVANVEGTKSEAEATTTVTLVGESGGPALPAELALDAPAPNPARGAATARLALPAAADVDVRVFDLLGREVLRVAEGEHAAGWHPLRVDAGDLAAGVYVLRLRTADRLLARRFAVVR